MSIDYRVYLKTRDQYLVNAEKLLAKREYRKAFELLWGAIAQSIKALVAKRGYRLGTHRQIIDFMREVAK